MGFSRQRGGPRRAEITAKNGHRTGCLGPERAKTARKWAAAVKFRDFSGDFAPSWVAFFCKAT
jgi:hypothetical protein